MKLNPKIIFIGTPEFGAVILEKLIKAGISPVLVVTAPDKPAGRKLELTPPPVKVVVKKYRISIEQPKKIENCKLKIENLQPDLIVVAAYGQILPKEILALPKFGCLNVHPSLLPRWRGPSPVQFTILSGDEETGVTIMLMDEKMDHGPILAQREWEILNPKSEIRNKSQILNSKITSSELSKKLADLGAELLVKTISKWINGEIKPIPQDDSKATYSKIIRKEDGRIDWKKPAEEIERQIRAFFPWPGTFTSFNDKNLKILKADILLTQIEKQIGEVFLTDDNKLAVQTGQNCLILQKLQVEGGKSMPADELLRGRQNFIGTTLS